jgi:hypothetical protein
MKENPSSATARTILSTLLLILGVGLVVLAININPLTVHGGTTAKSVAANKNVSPLGPTTNLSNGITFDHATWNDPIRMVGEPDVEIDNHGAIYVSGPGGTPTQTSWFWKSDDNGIQWHIIGCPDKSNCQNGGGDTEIALAVNRDLFASDLQTLQCNSTFRSFDGGQTFLPGEGCFPETDRQWMGLFDPTGSATGRRIYLAADGTAQGCYCLVSTDNGVTYQPPDPVNNPTAAIDGANGRNCIGRFAVDPNNGDIFAPLDGGTTFVSTDGGVTWNARGSSGAQGNFFSTIQMDTAGNLWQAWTEGSKAFLSYSVDRGVTWHSKIQVSTGPASPIGTSPDLRQMIFPWMAVGDPGRVAVVFYATTDTQNDNSIPSVGGPNAVWHVYATFSTNAMDANPTFTQVQATEHAMHRGAICLGGFPGCLTANSDRSMADFFVVDKDPHGRIFISYNENSDLSEVVPAPAEYIGKPINAVIRLRTGPSLFASQGNLLPLPSPANVAITSASANSETVSVSGTQGLPPGNWTTDPSGDAPFPVIPVTSANHPALDILEASASDDGTNLTFKLSMADLSATALADAATAGGTPTWMVTWWEGKNGLGPSGVTSGPFHSHWFVKCLDASAAAPQFVYGKVSSVDFAALGAPTPKFLTYTPAGTATGNVTGNVITITVPLAGVGPLVAGDKIDHIIAYSNVEHADSTLNDWADQAKSFSYIIGTPAASQHLSDGYVEVSLDNFQTSGRATLNPNNNTWTASIPGNGGTVCARQVLAKDLYTSAWDDVQAGPVSCFQIPVPVPTGVVSRKTHGSAGTFDINLPLAGTRGIECRSGGASNNYTLVFTFPNNLTSVLGAVVTNHNPTSGTGTVSSSSIGPNANQYTVNLTNVSNSQYLVVTLNRVLDATGQLGDVTGPKMGVLNGDTNGDGFVNSADISQTKSKSGLSVVGTNFREDVNTDGFLNSADISLTKSKSGTALP